MFGNVPPPSRSQPGFFGFVKSCYKDSTKWDMIKSWAMFAFGVYISKEICSIDLTAPPSPA
ncbi:unnamed protein product [Larinioides sclopetarius]|uniref:Uncharacterized protein n=1 Tax=Larinioides sclopetarius TaxID=280406 RepID=A0AAV2AM84_9ARAC